MVSGNGSSSKNWMGEASLSDLSFGIASGQREKEIVMLLRASRFAMITNQSLDFFERIMSVRPKAVFLFPWGFFF